MAILTSDADLRALLRETKTIAVVGLSNDPGRDSHRVAQYLQLNGYRIIPVNPNIIETLGARAVPNLESLGAPVDMVNIFRRPEHVGAIVETAIRIDARSVWMQLGAVDEDAAERASHAGLAVVVDRCIMVDHRRLRP
jgi:predicted CoA-binding protein